MPEKIIFIDRDGVINWDPIGDYIKRPQDFRFLPGVGSSLMKLTQSGFKIIIISNQAGVGDGVDRTLVALPLFHAFGLTCGLNLGLLAGVTQILFPNPRDTRGLVEAIHRLRPTIFPVVPTLLVGIASLPDLARFDLSSIRVCPCAGSPLAPAVQRVFTERTGVKVSEGYGLTEAGPVTHYNPVQGKRPLGSMCMPLPGTLAKVMDQETGARELPPGEVGELAIQGPQVMQGYWQNPQETEAVLRDGWLYTGDLARQDEDGYFYIVERKKDLIISGGYNIYPREVEEVVYQFPGVQEAVAFGLPDAYRGEIVKVVIVPRDGAELNVQELRDFCGQQLAVYKVPKIVEFRAELPKSLVGKVLRRLLREEAEAGSPAPAGND
jgi:long-chain acyl-CoA synthetase